MYRSSRVQVALTPCLFWVWNPLIDHKVAIVTAKNKGTHRDLSHYVPPWSHQHVSVQLGYNRGTMGPRSRRLILQTAFISSFHPQRVSVNMQEYYRYEYCTVQNIQVDFKHAFPSSSIFPESASCSRLRFQSSQSCNCTNGSLSITPANPSLLPCLLGSNLAFLNLMRKGNDGKEIYPLSIECTDVQPT
jgi:hypothetical protein